MVNTNISKLKKAGILKKHLKRRGVIKVAETLKALYDKVKRPSNVLNVIRLDESRIIYYNKISI